METLYDTLKRYAKIAVSTVPVVTMLACANSSSMGNAARNALKKAREKSKAGELGAALYTVTNTLDSCESVRGYRPEGGPFDTLRVLGDSLDTLK